MDYNEFSCLGVRRPKPLWQRAALPLGAIILLGTGVVLGLPIVLGGSDPQQRTMLVNFLRFIAVMIVLGASGMTVLVLAKSGKTKSIRYHLTEKFLEIDNQSVPYQDLQSETVKSNLNNEVLPYEDWKTDTSHALDLKLDRFQLKFNNQYDRQGFIRSLLQHLG